MRKLILALASSFDGFIEGPNREIDWMQFTEDTGNSLVSFSKEIDTVLYGRISYDDWGNYTPPLESSATEKEFYKAVNKMKKYVFSKSKEKFEGDPVVIKENISETISALKAQPGKDIWVFGGGSLITTLMNLDLIDEFRIAVMPIILGAGMPMFKDVSHRVKLQLKEVKSSSEGIVEFTYERATATLSK